MDFKHCRWSMLVWQGYCSFPIPWWRKHAYKNRRREKSLFTQQKVRKKRGLYISTLEQTEIYTHHVHTSHQSAEQQPEGNSIRGQRFQSLAAQRKGKSKYCQCPGVASWINHFLFVEFQFVQGSLLSETPVSGSEGIFSPQRWARSLLLAVVSESCSISDQFCSSQSLELMRNTNVWPLNLNWCSKSCYVWRRRPLLRN